MVKDAKLLARFEKDYLRHEKLAYPQALKLYEALWLEARDLGAFKDPWEGIENKIKLARILNKCSNK